MTPLPEVTATAPESKPLVSAVERVNAIGTLSAAEEWNLRHDPNRTKEMAVVHRELVASKIALAIAPGETAALAAERDELARREAEIRQRKERIEELAGIFHGMLNANEALRERRTLALIHARDWQWRHTELEGHLKDCIGKPAGGIHFAPAVADTLAKGRPGLEIFKGAIAELEKELADSAAALKGFAKAHEIPAQYLPEDIR